MGSLKEGLGVIVKRSEKCKIASNVVLLALEKQTVMLRRGPWGRKQWVVSSCWECSWLTVSKKVLPQLSSHEEVNSTHSHMCLEPDPELWYQSGSPWAETPFKLRSDIRLTAVWANKWVLSEVTEFVVVCYTEIENEYNMLILLFDCHTYQSKPFCNNTPKCLSSLI